MKHLHVLGIETSCDETSAAIVSGTGSGMPRLVAQRVLSQARAHEPFGGVVPEIASRSHVEALSLVIESCLTDARLRGDELDAIAVAHRPGLIGALLIGVTTAKALAWAWRKPLIGIHHLEAHLEAPLLTSPEAAAAAAAAGENARDDWLTPPFLGVVLSGGHTDLYVISADGKREHIGGTLDDAVGEAFDKVASIIGLGYPGGPAVERAARGATAGDLRLPRTLLGATSLDFSFSGIKTAVLYLWRGQDVKAPGPVAGAPTREQIAAAFQEAVGDVLVEKLRRALRATGLRKVVLGGGVVANRYLRDRVRIALAEQKVGEFGVPYADQVIFPEPAFATDNGAMIAALALKKFKAGEFSTLDLEASPS
ncbi:MAG: tRNA (adenosine(37)-N6)-threonylcarbamoyltransferase complex transferase subunit TsaD [Planctomycetota bacterium]